LEQTVSLFRHKTFDLCLLIVIIIGFYTQRITAQEKVLVGQADSPVFADIYEIVLKDAGIDYQFVVLPTARKRRMFVDGKILIDCCAAIGWRTRPKEIATQLNSNTFIRSAEHYFYHVDKNREVSSLEDLKNFRFAKVRGYVYQFEQYFGDVIEASTVEETMKLVALKRADVSLSNVYDFKHRLAEIPMPLRLGGKYEDSLLVIRVHKKAAELLPRINAAISKLKAEGHIMRALDPAAGNSSAVSSVRQ
jgi:hypothetical protein